MPDNPMLSEAFATLRLYSTEWQPEDVTARLGLEPSYSHRLGESHGRRSLVWRHSCWNLTSRYHVTSTDLEEHIAWLLDQIEPVREAFIAIRGMHSSADVFCMVVSRRGHGGPGFSPRLLGRLAALDLSLGLDIYFDGEDMQEAKGA